MKVKSNRLGFGDIEWLNSLRHKYRETSRYPLLSYLTTMENNALALLRNEALWEEVGLTKYEVHQLGLVRSSVILSQSPKLSAARSSMSFG